MELVRWLSVLAAVGVLVFIAFNRHRRAQEMIKRQADIPKPTEAEIRAAKDSIRVKTVEAVVRSKRNAIEDIWIFVFLLCAAALFLDGMPLNAYFTPWGKVLIAASGVTGVLALSGLIGTFVAQRYKRQMDAWLDELEEGD